MTSIFIVKAGTTFPSTAKKYGDFEDWVCTSMAPVKLAVKVVDALGGELPKFNGCAGIIVTGSHAMVTDNLPWSCRLEQWLLAAFNLGIPILGICYGHQLLAKALGGVVERHSGGPEIGCFLVSATRAADSDPLFRVLGPEFNAHLTHHQSVAGLPSEAVILAENQYEPIQAFRVGDCAWGVQFHPEYSKEVMCEYLFNQKAVIDQKGDSFDLLMSNIQDTPVARKLLSDFSDFCESKSSGNQKNH